MKSKDSSTNPLNGKIIALVVTIIILAIGSFFYFNPIFKSTGMSENSSKLTDTDKSQASMNSNNAQQRVNTNTQNNSNPIYNPDISESSQTYQENKIYIKNTPEGIPVLFYYHSVDEPLNIQLSEGNLEEYQIHSIGGQKYYPLIVGYDEARVMKQQGLFTNIGDPIKNFFGKNVVVVGVLTKTDGVLDVAYVIPLSKEEFG